MAQTVKRLPTMRETSVRSLGLEEALKEMATLQVTFCNFPSNTYLNFPPISF